MKKFYKKSITAILGVLVSMILFVPSVAFAAEAEMEQETGMERDGKSSDTTDIKILDSMPIIFTDSDLNAALAVLDMSEEDDPVDVNDTTVSSGTVLTYVISYRNTNETTEIIHMQIPVPDTFPLRSSYRGKYEGTLVNWDGIEVLPGETVTRYITCDTPTGTGMIPNTGLISISDGQTMQTNTVNVAVSAPAAIADTPTPISITPPAPEAPRETGVLGAVRRALKAAVDSPAVLGMRRAIQTGDVPYIAIRVAFLAAICTAFACVIVLLTKHKKSSKAR